MWAPEASSLERLVDLLNQTQIPDSTIQQKVSEEINNLSQNPEIYNYLAYISCLENNNTISSSKTQNVAGVVLKGMIERNYEQIPPENLDYVKTSLIQAFHNHNQAIQNVSIFLFTKLDSQQWPEFSQLLITNLNSDNTELINTSLKCVTKILEDLGNPDDVDSHLLAELTPKFLSFCTSAWPVSIQETALKSLNALAIMMPPALIQNFENYFNILFENAYDSQNINLRKLSCEGLKLILDNRRDMIHQNLERVLETLLKLTLDPDNQVRKEAVGFWNEFFVGAEGGFDDRPELIQNTLTILMPALLDCMQYSEEDMLEEENAKENHSIDIEEDDEEKEPLEDNESAHEDENEDGDTFKYTLRKEAAYVMEIVTRQFEQDAFAKIQSKLEHYLGNENNWIIKESAILCLGVLARGAFEAITTHFEHLFPFLMQSLESNEGLLRSTTCWTLSRFKSWIVNRSRQDPDIMKAYLPAILKLMTDDDNVKVQQASCSALASLSSEGPEFIEESINDVIQAIVIALDKYQDKKIISSVYDAIGMMAASLSPEVVQSEAVESPLMEALLQKWAQESSFDCNADAILIETVDSMMTALGENAKKYAETLINGAFDIIISYLEKKCVEGTNQKQLDQKRGIAIRCIDLFGTFLAVLKTDALQYVNSENYFTIFQECVNDKDVLLRQCILASVAEVVKASPAFLNNYIEKIAEALDQSLNFDPLMMACLNNAAFAVGEFAIAYGQSLHKYIPDFAKKISQILSGSPKFHRSVGITLASAIGRLGLVCPDDVLPFLQSCLKSFCICMLSFRPHDIECTQALKGGLQMILKDPQVATESVPFLFNLLANIDQDLAELHQLASQVLHHFVNSAGGDFPAFYQKLTPQTRQSLTQHFGITF